MIDQSSLIVLKERILIIKNAIEKDLLVNLKNLQEVLINAKNKMALCRVYRDYPKIFSGINILELILYRN